MKEVFLSQNYVQDCMYIAVKSLQSKSSLWWLLVQGMPIMHLCSCTITAKSLSDCSFCIVTASLLGLFHFLKYCKVLAQEKRLRWP